MNKNMRFPAGLVICLIIQSLIGGCIGVKEWVCTSKYSEYTKQYCKDNGPTKGCYFVPHFNEYRSCSTICNNVRTMSLDEGKCNDLCGGYLSGYGDCIPTDVTVSPELSSTTATDVQSVTSLVRGTTVSQTNQQSLSSWKIALAVVVPIILVAVIIACTLCAKQKKKLCWADKAVPQHDEEECPMLNVDGAENGRASGAAKSTGHATGAASEIDPVIENDPVPSNGQLIRDDNPTQGDTACENGDVQDEAATKCNPPTRNEASSENIPAARLRLTVKSVQETGIDGTCSDTNSDFNRVPTPSTSPNSAIPPPILPQTDEMPHLPREDEHVDENTVD